MEINLAPVLQLRDSPAQPTAPLRIDGVAPALRPYVPESMPVPPEPTISEPTWAQLAEQERQALMRNPQFVEAYNRGDFAAASKFRYIHQILQAKGVPEHSLYELAKAAGISKPPASPLPPPPVDPMAHETKLTDYKFSASLAPEDVTTAGGFVSTLKMHPALGNALVDRIANLEPKLAVMSLSEYGSWVDAQERQLGSPETAKALRDDARRALQLAGNHPWAKIDAAALQDAWLIRTLATRWRSHAQTKGIK